MFDRKIVAAATMLLGATLAGNALAYPYTARSGTSTVTGTYRPLTLDLNLIESWSPCEECWTYRSRVLNSEGVAVTAVFTGTYTTTGDSILDGGSPISGDAGYWYYEYYYEGSTDFSVVGNASAYGFDIIAGDGYGGAFSAEFGTLTYLGGGSFAGVPYEDTPQTASDTRGDDWFQYYTTLASRVLRVNSDQEDGSDFTLSFEQNIKHLGPFGSPLDPARTNTACFTGGTPSTTLDVNGNPVNAIPCGTATLTAAAAVVPEPTSMALVGLGLGALAIGLRRSRRIHRHE